MALGQRWEGLVGPAPWRSEPLPLSCLARRPQAGSLTWRRAGGDRVCVAGAAGPVKAAPLTVLLQEGGLGWAGLG